MKLWVVCLLAVLSYAVEEQNPEDDFSDDPFEEAPLDNFDLTEPEVPQDEPVVLGKTLYQRGLEGAMMLPLKLEEAYFEAYAKLRANTVVYLISFYGVALYILSRCCSKKRLNVHPT